MSFHMATMETIVRQSVMGLVANQARIWIVLQTKYDCPRRFFVTIFAQNFCPKNSVEGAYVEAVTILWK